MGRRLLFLRCVFRELRWPGLCFIAMHWCVGLDYWHWLRSTLSTATGLLSKRWMFTSGAGWCGAAYVAWFICSRNWTSREILIEQHQWCTYSTFHLSLFRSTFDANTFISKVFPYIFLNNIVLIQIWCFKSTASVFHQKGKRMTSETNNQGRKHQAFLWQIVILDIGTFPESALY